MLQELQFKQEFSIQMSKMTGRRRLRAEERKKSQAKKDLMYQTIACIDAEIGRINRHTAFVEVYSIDFALREVSYENKYNLREYYRNQGKFKEVYWENDTFVLRRYTSASTEIQEMQERMNARRQRRNSLGSLLPLCLVLLIVIALVLLWFKEHQ
jgi:hypothetical protein